MEAVSLSDEIRDIPLDDLVINISQVRTKDVEKGISELADSIKKVGLLSPIVVCPAEEEGKYEIIAGQRRYLAHKMLDRKTIKAVVIDDQLSETDAKILSLTENWLRLGLTPKDEKDACLLLWRRYKNVDLIVEELGLPKSKVRKYLKFQDLIQPLKDMVDNNDVDLDAAYRGQLVAVTPDGTIKEAEAIEAAKELHNMSDPMQKKAVNEKKKNPEKQTDEILETVKAGGKITQIQISLLSRQHEALKDYAKDEKTNQNAAAGNLIEESLINKGFLDPDE